MSVTVDALPELPISIDPESQTPGDAERALYAEINACHDDGQLDRIASRIWYARGQNQLTDAAAEHLHHCVILRRRAGGTKQAVRANAQRLAGRVGSRFVPRKPPRSPNREVSRNRRRVLGGSSALPDTSRHHYTKGQRAVLCVVAGEVKRHSVCDLPIDMIAALAGVCRTSVQNTLHEARRLRHIKITERPQPGRKHLPNIIEIVAPAWLAWIKRGSSAARAIGSRPVKIVSTTKSKDKGRKRLGRNCSGAAAPNRQPEQTK